MRVLTQHQLTPELAEDIAQAKAVIFADAALGLQSVAARPVSIDSSGRPAPQAHVSDPDSLIRLAQALFGRSPLAWLVTVPARNLDFGAPPSPEMATGVAAAVKEIRDLIGTLPGGHNRLDCRSQESQHQARVLASKCV